MIKDVNDLKIPNWVACMSPLIFNEATLPVDAMNFLGYLYENKKLQILIVMCIFLPSLNIWANNIISLRNESLGSDPRPLNVLVCGGIEYLAQALHDAPYIFSKLLSVQKL